jgi:hypothetical protein
MKENNKSTYYLHPEKKDECKYCGLAVKNLEIHKKIVHG